MFFVGTSTVHVKNPPGRNPTNYICWKKFHPFKMIPKQSTNFIERGGPRKVTSPPPQKKWLEVGNWNVSLPFLLNICPYYFRDIRSSSGGGESSFSCCDFSFSLQTNATFGACLLTLRHRHRFPRQNEVHH